MQGKVKWFDVQNGYGFIEQEEDDMDVFVHISDVDPNILLETGDKVQFEIEPALKGLKARNVTKI